MEIDVTLRGKSKLQYSENAIRVLAANSYRGIGPSWIITHMHDGPDIEGIVERMNRTAGKRPQITADDFRRTCDEVQQSLRDELREGDMVLALGDRDFPEPRGHVNKGERPVVLFCRGNTRLLAQTNCNLAVIGLLQPDAEIEARERRFVSGLVGLGATIVSGLALGCDTIAHEQTVACGGRTVAILPSPLGEVLPKENRQLADRIVAEDGLLVTEYLLPSRSGREMRGRYQERDRLQAMFSDGIFLTASYAKNDQGLDSGSRLAMEYARVYRIPRYVMYDEQRDGENPRFDLNRQILRSDRTVLALDDGNFQEVVRQAVQVASRPSTGRADQLDLFG